MNIGNAVEALKAGKCVRRAGWNGKGMYLYQIQQGPTWAGGDVIDANAKQLEPCIVIVLPDSRNQPGWNASTPDLLAEDWEILD